MDGGDWWIRSMLKKLMPTTYLLISLILIVCLHIIFPIAAIVPGMWKLFGLIPLLFGIVLNLAADQALKRSNTTVKPFQDSNALVENGVYRISRHPMYLGFLLILIGVSLLLGSISPYIIVFLFLVFIEIVFIRTEERMLQDSFPEAWAKYKSKVRRWI
jgi:protein-S-isoprenylcysteine O-methyltransferase Ste14